MQQFVAATYQYKIQYPENYSIRKIYLTHRIPQVIAREDVFEF